MALAHSALALFAAALLASPAMAQRADENAVTAAEDAFGSTIGNESIGLYTSTQVRGFSPVSAGNVRIEGLYFDRQGGLPTRLLQGSTIHVGLSAQSYPFPAPTGIVDYRLRKASEQRVVSLVTGLNAYTSPSIEIDAKVPLVPNRLGVAAGVSFADEEYYDGSDARYWRAAIVPRWRPSESVEVMPFWSVIRGRDEEVAPTIITAGSYLPPEIERRRYFGQWWADNDTQTVTYGTLAKARLGTDWAISGGIFRSVYDTPRGFADIYAGTQPDGLTREFVIADPQQRYASTSGEARVSRSFVEGERLHVLHFSLRARDQDSVYGGSTALDLGPRMLGERIAAPRPDAFQFGERTRDEVSQRTIGLAYEGRWRGVGEASVGLQRTDYEKRIEQPGLPQTGTSDQPWLVNGTIAAHLSPVMALYGGYTRGLEESGIAPDNATNRNEALPAIRTMQWDAGVRWTIAPDLKLVAGVFDVEKPYFTTDGTNVYAALGEVRHRGFELSISGALSRNLSAVLGAVIMEPRVTGDAVVEGRVGEKPVGQTDRILKANIDYRPPAWPSLSFDVAIASYGERVGSSDNRAIVPSYTLVDLRVQAANVTDEFAWYVLGSNSYTLSDARRFSALLFVDF
jgi:iron complex outermembrane receptor protein